MKTSNKEISFEDAIEIADIDNSILKRRNNGLLLSDYQVNVLSDRGIMYEKYGSIHELLFDIEEILNNEYDDELDSISKQLAEMAYYRETKK